MAEQINRLANRIICGDSFELIKQIPNKSINLIITSPPYFKQRNYGGFGVMANFYYGKIKNLIYQGLCSQL
ncbi:MAG: site-specific DNA-methyltransferase [Thermosipho sp. (in: Bacteria)]|nr:site-specific DNA-methyltransferase [Thermosipho sp. (in: thermotogales)]